MRVRKMRGSPPEQQEGWPKAGWCGQEFLDHTTPAAPLKEASLLLLCVAATPPPAEEGSRLRQLLPPLASRCKAVIDSARLARRHASTTTQAWCA
jgi:hypothetical protein